MARTGPAGESSGLAAADRDDRGGESDVGRGERIAAELLVKLGIRLSPRTVRRYMGSRPPRPNQGTQGWSMFVRNRSVLATDFFVVVTATFRILYVFVVLEGGRRRILLWNVTKPPKGNWTAQHFGHGSDDPQHTHARSTSECVLRTLNRDDSPRMLGFHHCDERGARASDSSGVGPSFQYRPATRAPGPR